MSCEPGGPGLWNLAKNPGPPGSRLTLVLTFVENVMKQSIVSHNCPANGFGIGWSIYSFGELRWKMSMHDFSLGCQDRPFSVSYCSTSRRTSERD